MQARRARTRKNFGDVQKTPGALGHPHHCSTPWRSNAPYFTPRCCRHPRAGLCRGRKAVCARMKRRCRHSSDGGGGPIFGARGQAARCLSGQLSCIQRGIKLDNLWLACPVARRWPACLPNFGGAVRPQLRQGKILTLADACLASRGHRQQQPFCLACQDQFAVGIYPLLHGSLLPAAATGTQAQSVIRSPVRARAARPDPAAPAKRAHGRRCRSAARSGAGHAHM